MTITYPRTFRPRPRDPIERPDQSPSPARAIAEAYFAPRPSVFAQSNLTPTVVVKRRKVHAHDHDHVQDARTQSQSLPQHQHAPSSPVGYEASAMGTLEASRDSALRSPRIFFVHTTAAPALPSVAPSDSDDHERAHAAPTHPVTVARRRRTPPDHRPKLVSHVVFSDHGPIDLLHQTSSEPVHAAPAPILPDTRRIDDDQLPRDFTANAEALHETIFAIGAKLAVVGESFELIDPSTALTTIAADISAVKAKLHQCHPSGDSVDCDEGLHHLPDIQLRITAIKEKLERLSCPVEELGPFHDYASLNGTLLSIRDRLEWRRESTTSVPEQPAPDRKWRQLLDKSEALSSSIRAASQVP